MTRGLLGKLGACGFLGLLGRGLSLLLWLRRLGLCRGVLRSTRGLGLRPTLRLRDRGNGWNAETRTGTFPAAIGMLGGARFANRFEQSACSRRSVAAAEKLQRDAVAVGKTANFTRLEGETRVARQLLAENAHIAYFFNVIGRLSSSLPGRHQSGDENRHNGGNDACSHFNFPVTHHSGSVSMPLNCGTLRVRNNTQIRVLCQAGPKTIPRAS